jgi:uridine kinase
MPFGMTNGKTTFMQLINDIFSPDLGNLVVIHLDDIFIFNKSRKDHLRHVCRILYILREHKLQVKEKK